MLLLASDSQKRKPCTVCDALPPAKWRDGSCSTGGSESQAVPSLASSGASSGEATARASLRFGCVDHGLFGV